MEEPIIINDYDPEWVKKYEKEKNEILQAIGEYIIAIEHIGSTAVVGLASKPIIDILIGLSSLEDAKKCIPILKKMNYEYVPEHEKILPDRRYFRKQPDGTANRKYHVHMVEINSHFWNRQLLFRDYLRKNPEVLKDYETVKRLLAKKFQNDRHSYTTGKEGFILLILEKAEKELKK